MKVLNVLAWPLDAITGPAKNKALKVMTSVSSCAFAVFFAITEKAFLPVNIQVNDNDDFSYDLASPKDQLPYWAIITTSGLLFTSAAALLAKSLLGRAEKQKKI